MLMNVRIGFISCHRVNVKVYGLILIQLMTLSTSPQYVVVRQFV